MTAEQRSHADNGIWLCAMCADLIDDDERKYSVETLKTWKAKANREAHIRVATGVAVQSVLSHPVSLVAGVVDRARQAVRNDLQLFREQSAWPQHEIQLSFRVGPNRDDQPVTVDGLATGLEVNSELLLVSPPGTGKTTSIVQIAMALLQRGSFVPLYIPLKEWGQQNEDIFGSVMARRAFQKLARDDFTWLAAEGRLAVLLDGWNELGALGKQRAIATISALRRDYPMLRIVTSTRREAVDLPFGGIRVDIQPLSEKQQVELAEAISGPSGHQLLERAWRTPGVRELVAIPLYLSVLLANAPGGQLPETKEEVLRLFVAKHDTDPASALSLREAVHGVHDTILAALAFEIMKIGDVAMTDDTARIIVGSESTRLLHDTQVVAPLQPATVIDTLVARHVIVRSSDGLLSFQHQQFQEWYASRRVEALMRSIESDVEACQTLRKDILNLPHWEEPLLFAIERLSRSPDGYLLAARTIIETLTVDPMLAAEMVFRASTGTWSLIASQVVDFALRWHSQGTVDRAVRFMILCGRTEFANTIWSLLEHKDQQVRLACTRAAPRIRAGALGHDVSARVQLLSNEIRNDLLSELVLCGDMETIELAVSLARQEPSDSIRAATIHSLMFRAADRLAVELLKASGSNVWRKIAEELFDDEIEDSEVRDRLRDERRRSVEEQKDPWRRLDILVGSEQSENNERHIIDLISDANLPLEGRNTTYIFERVGRKYPQALHASIMRRLEQGLKIPYEATEIIAALPVVEDGPIASLALGETYERHDVPDAVQVVGPTVVGRLIDRLLELAPSIYDRSNRPPKGDVDLFFNIQDRICRTRFGSFAEALLKRANTTDVFTIARLADLLSRDGSETSQRRQPVTSEFVTELGEAIQRWSRTLLTSVQASRHDFAEVISAVARLPDERHLPSIAAFLQEDLRRWRQAKEDWLRNRGGPLTADTSTSYGLQYRRALASIGGAHAAAIAGSFLRDDFVSTDMAHCLRDIYDNRIGIVRSHRHWPDFSDIAEARKADEDKLRGPAPVEVQPILTTIKWLITEGAGEHHYQWAINLAFVAFQMPCGEDAGLVEELLALPIPLQNKLDFLTVLTTRRYIPSGEMLLAGVNEWLSFANKEPWRREQTTYRLIDWLQLLPFSDRPTLVLEGIRLAGTAGLQVWEFRDVLSALAVTPYEDAEQIIVQLARDRPEFAEIHEWLYALLRRNTQSAVQLLIEYLRDAPDKARKKADQWFTARALQPLVQASADLRAMLVRHYQDPKYASCRDLIANIFAEAADASALIAMVRAAAKSDCGPPGCLPRATRSAVTFHRSIGGNSYEIEPLPTAELRQQLFAMALQGGRLGKIAEDSLTHIDRLRDKYGTLDEPRHPDIQTGLPWPRLLCATDA